LRQCAFEFTDNTTVDNHLILEIEKLYLDNLKVKPRGYKKTLRCFCFNLLKINKHYDLCYVAIGKNTKIPEGYSQGAMNNILNLFEDMGYISCYRGYKVNNRLEKSYFILNERMSELLVKYDDPCIDPIQSVLVVRRNGVEGLSFDESVDNSEEIDFLIEYNQRMLSNRLTLDDEPYSFALRRIYQNDFKNGGRFYSLCGSIQNMKKYDRKRLKINDEETIELDYKALHLMLLYEMVGLQYDFDYDPYSDYRLERDKMKLVSLITINSKNRSEAIRAIRCRLFESGVSSGLSDKEISSLIYEFEFKHKEISKYFNTSYGLRLQNVESDIMFNIMRNCHARNIVAIPIHDSVITTKGKFKDVLNIMFDSYSEVMGSVYNCRVELK